MFRIILLASSLFAIISINVAANTIPLNGKKTIEIMNSLPIPFTPASYVFFIWFAIYFFLTIWVIGFYKTRHEKTSYSLANKQTALFVGSSILNGAWFFLWHFEYFDIALLVITILAITLAVLYFTYPKGENKLTGRVPISLYLGWIIIVWIANAAFSLTWHDWSGWGISIPLWTVAILTVATAIALHFLYHYKDFSLNLVFMWAFVGIAVINGFETLFITIASLFLTGVIAACYFFLRTTYEQT